MKEHISIYLKHFKLNKSELKQIKDISRSTIFTERKIYRSYHILKSFDLVKEAANYSMRSGVDFIEASYAIKSALDNYQHERNINT